MAPLPQWELDIHNFILLFSRQSSNGFGPPLSRLRDQFWRPADSLELVASYLRSRAQWYSLLPSYDHPYPDGIVMALSTDKEDPVPTHLLAAQRPSTRGGATSLSHGAAAAAPGAAAANGASVAVVARRTWTDLPSLDREGETTSVPLTSAGSAPLGSAGLGSYQPSGSSSCMLPALFGGTAALVANVQSNGSPARQLRSLWEETTQPPPPPPPLPPPPPKALGGVGGNNGGIGGYKVKKKALFCEACNLKFKDHAAMATHQRGAEHLIRLQQQQQQQHQKQEEKQEDRTGGSSNAGGATTVGDGGGRSRAGGSGGSGQRSFSCLICQHCFSSAAELTRHQVEDRRCRGVLGQRVSIGFI